MSLFFSFIPYILAVATIFGGGIELYRKRDEYKNKRIRQVVVGLFIVTGFLSFIGLYHENAEKAVSEKRADDSNKELKRNMQDAVKAEKTISLGWDASLEARSDIPIS